jgi:hypothetical protein
VTEGVGATMGIQGGDILRFWRRAHTILLAMPSWSPTSSSTPIRTPLRITPESRHRESHLKPDEKCVKKVRPIAQRARAQQKETTQINQKIGYGCRRLSALQRLKPK